MKVFLQFLVLLGILALTSSAAAQEGVLEKVPEASCQAALEFMLKECLINRGNTDFPGIIKGDVLYACERIRSGWLIYLCAPESAANDNKVEIKLDIKKVRFVISSMDLLTRKRLPKYDLQMALPAGQFQIIYVVTESFEPDYERYFH